MTAETTVVAWYGDKPACLVELVTGLQRVARQVLGSEFAPRPPADVHATILGLETPVPGVRSDVDGLKRYLAAEIDERYGFRHKYHRRPEDLDADVYLVVGDIAEPERAGAAGLVERMRREVLATPVRLLITVDDVSLVEYVDSTLPAATSGPRPLR